MNETLRLISERYQVALEPPYPIRLPASRTDLPALCRALKFRRGAEVGVWKGEYSKLFCQAGLDWTCVDPWESYPAYDDQKNDPQKIAAAHTLAFNLLYPLGATFIRKPSVEGASYVPDDSLDVVYLDANHTADYVRADIEAWVPKVRSGGLMAGHDYRVNPRKPFIQVKPTVDRYTTEHRIAPWFLFARDSSPSFLWVVW